MFFAVPKEFKEEYEEKQKKLQQLIMDGVEQMNAGQLKDFDAVCERLEKKYKDAGLQNKDYGSC